MTILYLREHNKILGLWVRRKPEWTITAVFFFLLWWCMNQRTVVFTGLLLAVISFAVLLLTGQTYRYSARLQPGADDPEDYEVEIEQEQEVIRLEEKEVRRGSLILTFRSVSRGRAYLSIKPKNSDSGIMDHI